MTLDAAPAGRRHELERLVRAAQQGDQLAMADLMDLLAPHVARELPQYLPDVRRFTITRRVGDRLEADARGHLGLRARFDVVLRPGWCVMQSRFLLGAMAAEPAVDGTRFAFLGGFRLPGLRTVAPVIRLVGRPAVAHVVGRYGARVAARTE